MSRKTIAMFVVDSGSSMGKGVKDSETGSNEYNRHDVAISSVVSSIIQKSALKSFEAGVCIFGSGTTNNSLAADGFYQNVDEILPIGRCSSTVKELLKVKPGRAAGDLIDGLVVGVKSLESYSAGKANRGTVTSIFLRELQIKFDTTLPSTCSLSPTLPVVVVVTDGETQLSGIEDLEEVCTEMKSKGCTLSVVMIGDSKDILNCHIRSENAKLFSGMATRFNPHTQPKVTAMSKTLPTA